MKKFITNILIFLLLIILFNLILLIFSAKYFKDYEYFIDENYKSFIMSDSHGLPIGKSSEKFGVYNFSTGSDSYFDIKRKINFLIKKGIKIDTIYLTVDDHMLGKYRETTNNLDRSAIYLIPEDDFILYLKERYFNRYVLIFSSKIRSLFKEYLETKTYSLFSNKKKDEQFSWPDLSEERKIKYSENRRITHFPSKEKSKKLEQTLVDIINLCRKNNINLIGVKFPLSKTYITILNNRNYGADTIFYSNGLTVIDKKELFADNEEYFENQDHMNEEGGRKFTEILFR